MPPTQLTTLVAELAAAGIDFVLVGGLAAVAQGAPVTTYDVDIVHDRAAGNVATLVAFLGSVSARYRGRPGGAQLAPSADDLVGEGHHLLMTNLGPLDVLGTIDGGAAYQDLIANSIELVVSGHTVRVLGLRAIVEAKRRSTHPKDKLVLPVLEATLRRRNPG